MSENWVRWNTHHSTVVAVELFGTTFRLNQDPNSHNLGTTVWDSSIVFAKYIEKSARKGDFSRMKLKGKQVIELGAGMGLCSLALAVQGANVLTTDLASVLPLLRGNCEANISQTAIDGLPWASDVGQVIVQELDWYSQVHRQQAASKGPFDFVIAADCVYNEEHVAAFRATCLALMGPKTTLVVVNELRSETVHSRFLELMEAYFTHKKVLHSRMGSVQHPSIDIYIFKRIKMADSRSAEEGV